jgi:hypothetical protein
MPSPRRDDTAGAPMLRRFTDLRRYTIGASDGDLGSVEDAYFDDQLWTVRYLVVDTGTWLSSRKVLVSPAAVEALDDVGGRVQTRLTRAQVEESPSIDTARPVSRQHETALAAHYGQGPYWMGPYRWGPYSYPYPLLQAGVLPPIAESPYENRVAEELAAREQASQDPSLRSARAVAGYALGATDGELGHVEDFLIDAHDWAIRYLVVDPRSWWPGPHVLIGVDWIRGVSWNDSVVEVAVGREAVRNAPRYDPARPLDRREEAQLYAHHGRRGYWDEPSASGRHVPPAA